MQTVNIRSIVFTALFAALFIVFSIIQLRITASAVPITFQTLAVILAGVFLRPGQAFSSIWIVIVLAAFGLPVFGGKGGISHLIGATGGFIFAFPFCALLISLAMNRLLRSEGLWRSKWTAALLLFIVFELFGSLLSYIPGVPWMMHVTELPLNKALVAGFYPYLPGDAVKSAVAVVVTLSLQGYIRQLRSSHAKSSAQAAAPVGS
ncbi:biotin transporter BioY [Paenibacillus nanensis]|uniref:Biotin transporter n=1 Tax=Paenibacillus nanensis TaxID=393251 RepID=A0A3A1UTD6_9BACL|nr:biotin transporter BioY [Paenibacillus nanensis]RIX51747.1 biotin transporter BioY [Paenibacillus nanensis]